MLCGHRVSHAASSFELGDYSLQQPTIGWLSAEDSLHAWLQHLQHSCSHSVITFCVRLSNVKCISVTASVCLCVAMAQSSSDDKAICYVRPFLWMTWWLPIIGQANATPVEHTVLKVTDQGAAPGAKLMSAIALLKVANCIPLAVMP